MTMMMMVMMIIMMIMMIMKMMMLFSVLFNLPNYFQLRTIIVDNKFIEDEKFTVLNEEDPLHQDLDSLLSTPDIVILHYIDDTDLDAQMMNI